MKIKRELLLILLIAVSPVISLSQYNPDSLLQKATLSDCIQFALVHQPLVQQSLINEKIANQEIKVKLADWFPQINFNFNLQHNFVLPTTIFQGNPIHIGLVNISDAQFSATQTIFDRDVLLASSTAGDVRKQTKQTTEENKINVAVNVSKAFYAVLIIQNQIDLTNQDIARLEQSFDDSYNRFKSGVVDKTDYMQATIALNNAKAELRQEQEQLKTSYANLKDLMGYPPKGELELNYNMAKMEDDIIFDTTEALIYQNRIEYQLLQTQMSLQKANLDYYVWSFIPSLSVFGAYNFNFENNQFSNLYKRDYPSSYIGLQLSFPIFQGAKRIQQIQQAKLELNLIDYDQSLLESTISREFTTAMSNYKSNLNNFRVQKDNLKLAKEVYEIIELQYKSGIKTYLDVITAETNLRTTQINYLNAIYQVLISKMDLQKALGSIKY